MTDLSQIPEKHLKDELDRREEDRKREERIRLKIHRDFVHKHVGILLLFTPTHDRTSCSDEDPGNHGGNEGKIRCKRCRLLWIKNNKLNPDTSVYLDVEIEEDP